jgi:hypothetical protein
MCSSLVCTIFRQSSNEFFSSLFAQFFTVRRCKLLFFSLWFLISLKFIWKLKIHANFGATFWEFLGHQNVFDADRVVRLKLDNWFWIYWEFVAERLIETVIDLKFQSHKIKVRLKIKFNLVIDSESHWKMYWVTEVVQLIRL